MNLISLFSFSIGTGGLDDLVYHLHGYTFYVVGARKFGRSVSLQELKSMDDKGQLFSRNLDCTVAKDTVVVPKFGVVALRFKANNPGSKTQITKKRKNLELVIRNMSIIFRKNTHNNFAHLEGAELSKNQF